MRKTIEPWLTVCALLAVSASAQASHFGWRSVEVNGEEHGIVTSHGMELFEIVTPAGGYSPARRAELIADRLVELEESHDLSPQMFGVGIHNGTVVIQQQEHTEHPPHIVATIDPAEARRCEGAHGSAERLAQWRLALLRDHVSLATGKMPFHTSGTPAGDVFRSVYDRLNASGPVSSEEIEKAIGRLTPADRELLRNAASNVPESFREDRVLVVEEPSKHNDHGSDEQKEPGRHEDDKIEPGDPSHQERDSGKEPAPQTQRESDRPSDKDRDSEDPARIRKSGDYVVELLTDPVIIKEGKATVAVRLSNSQLGFEPSDDILVRAWLIRRGEKPGPAVQSAYDVKRDAYTFDLTPKGSGNYRLVVGVLAGADAAFKVEFPITLDRERGRERRPAEDTGTGEKRRVQRHGDYEVSVRTDPDPLRAGQSSTVEVVITPITERGEPTDRTDRRDNPDDNETLDVTGWFVPDGSSKDDVRARPAKQNPYSTHVYGWSYRFPRSGAYRLVVEVVPRTGDKFTAEFDLDVRPSARSDREPSPDR